MVIFGGKAHRRERRKEYDVFGIEEKDMICIGDGRVIGRACDVVLDPATGQALGLIVCGGCGIFRSEKSQMEIPWRQIACIGDDVILVSPGSC